MQNIEQVALRSAERAVYFVGDSHTLIYKGSGFEDRQTGENFCARVRYIPGLHGRNFYHVNKKLLHPQLEKFLAEEGLLSHVDNKQAAWCSTNKHDSVVSFVTQMPKIPPALVISVGDISLRSFLMEGIESYIEQNSFGSITSIPDAMLQDLIEFHFAPIVKGLVHLRKMGFINLHLLANPKSFSSCEDKLALHTNLRNRCNSFLETQCNKEKVNFIDIARSEDFDPSHYFLDGVHYSKKALVPTFSAVIAFALERKNYFCNRSRYKQLHQASPHISPDERFTDVCKAFNQNGFAKVDINCYDNEQLSFLKEKFNAPDKAVNQAFHHDWVGRKKRHHSIEIYQMEMTEEYLKAIHNLVFKTQVITILQSLFGRRLLLLNVKAVRSLPQSAAAEGPQEFHVDGCPDGVFRAILYLTDVTEENGPFCYKNNAQEIVNVTGSSGTLLLFDANKLNHKAQIPKSGERHVLDLIFLNQMEGGAPVSISSGMNSWPLDPCCFSLKNAVVVGMLESENQYLQLLK